MAMFGSSKPTRYTSGQFGYYKLLNLLLYLFLLDLLVQTDTVGRRLK